MFKRLFLLLLLITMAGWAAEVQGDLIVEILRADNDAPIAGAKVTVQDRLNLRAGLELSTDASGKARFENLPIGEYYVDISHPDYGGDRALVKTTSGVDTLYKTLLDPAGQEQVVRVRADRLLVNPNDPGDGAATRRERPFLDRAIANSNSVQGVLTTVPGIATDSVGQVHARGEHVSVSYSLDGVAVPIPLTSMTSTPLDPDFIETLDIRTGSYDATVGGQLGVMINALSPAGTKVPYVSLEPKFGNLGQYGALLKASGSNEDGSFGYFVGAKTYGSNAYFEAPDPQQQTLNNKGMNTSLLVRLSGKTDDDQVGFNLSYQNGAYGVPQTPQNYAAGVRLDQFDSNFLGLLSWKHKFSDDADVLMGMSVLRSSQLIRNNGIFTPFTVTPAEVSESLADEHLPLDPQNPGAPYLPTTDLVITQFQPSLTFTQRLGERQRFQAGLQADFISSRQSVFVTDPGGGSAIPFPNDPNLTASQLNARVNRNGFFGGIFASHTVPLGDVTLNYGVRADIFNNGANVSTGQISPVVNLSYALSETQALRASYNRRFQAPPLEIDVTGNTYVLPQRSNVYELSYENQLDKGITAKVAVVRKDFTDQIDPGLLIPNSNFPLFAPVNLGTAYYQGLELSLNTFYPVGWNGFATATLSVAKPLSGGQFSDAQLPEYNDHDQRVQATWGVSHTWENGFSAAVDFFYGSGFPLPAVPLYNAIGLTPYGLTGDRQGRFFTNLTFNFTPKEEPGDDGPVFGGGLQVLNLFDERPVLNFYSAFSGTRFATQRRILLNAHIKW